MPELPEVETIRRGLLPAVTDRRIAAVAARAVTLHGRPIGSMSGLSGCRIRTIARRGKYLLWHMADDGPVLLMHLGMSGQVVVEGGPDSSAPGAALTADRHTHLALLLDDGTLLRFRDPRRFGRLALLADAQALARHPALAALGPEPLGADFTPSYLHERLRASRARIKARLMDQSVVAGLGNIYVLEALHLAGIRPARRADRIGRRACARLVAAIRRTLEEAIAAGGSTLKDYRLADGSLGYFQHRFRVYGRAGEPCLAPGCSGTVRKRVEAGRTSYYCPRCQR
ncbi:MAG: bifunctional DNA-formamidopyrimidine glycosylase/DNA-(apurinic or apyrimidinic site) lyase [Alphaproteobacteria bacterium]|nr:MAG: bifunctional DNA-formamidopyrimidine glycosylase/DNA-(apurinic or apyrimidinic site) lyase [Alphaproteobacteria bacterium]